MDETRNYNLNILKTWSKEDTIAEIRKVPLMGDTNIYPYKFALINLEEYIITKLFPLSKYYIEERISTIASINEQLKINKMDLLHLNSLIEYECNNITYKMCPPIVEFSKNEMGKIVPSLVDGLHRCIYAMNNNNKTINCYVISNVPSCYPLMAWPIEWSEVNKVDTIPLDHNKRNLKFPDKDHFPDISAISEKRPISPVDCRYYFYRNLNNLGSSGRRG
jgi:hypothetical protein